MFALHGQGIPRLLLSVLSLPPPFRNSPIHDQKPAKASTTRASHVEASYTMTPADLELRTALHVFRRQQTVAKLGSAHLKNLGPAVIMGDHVLKRILDCARAQKIQTVEQLYRETKWNRAQEFGEEVLKLIIKYVLRIMHLQVLLTRFPLGLICPNLKSPVDQIRRRRRRVPPLPPAGYAVLAEVLNILVRVPSLQSA